MGKPFALLTLLCCSRLAFAAEAQPTPESETAEPEAVAPESGLLSTDDDAYQFEVPSFSAFGEGPTRISVASGVVIGRFGWAPLRFSIDNSEGPAGTIVLSATASPNGNASIKRVELAAGERRAVSWPVPVTIGSVSIEARGPGIKGTTSIYPGYGLATTVVLCIGTTSEYEAFTNRQPSADDPARRGEVSTRVLCLSPEEAPTETASYSSFDAVVLLKASSTLSAPVRSAIENQVLFGTALIVQAPLATSDFLPLLDNASPGVHPYGLGVVVIASEMPGPVVAKRDGQPVTPHAPRDSDARRYRGEDAWALLPQAQPKVGRFLAVILGFALLIGPGSVWLTRRRGPFAMLFSVPFIAAVTCALIIGLALLGEGLATHASFSSYTFLDTPRNRAITLGVAGYYANISPRRYELPLSATVWFSPDSSASVDHFNPSWADGILFPSELISSRSYREFGLTLIEPTRARLTVERNQDHVSVLNSLGGEVRALIVNVDGVTYASTGPVADGARATLVEKPDAVVTRLEPRNALSRTPSPMLPMLGGGSYVPPGETTPFFTDRTHAFFDDSGPKRGEFIALIEGSQGFMPTGGLQAELSNTQHLVRGAFTP